MTTKKFNLGDKVKILRAFTNQEYPSASGYISNMEEDVGREGVVINTNVLGEVSVETDSGDSGWFWPVDCVELVENNSPVTPEDYQELLDELTRRNKARVIKKLDEVVDDYRNGVNDDFFDRVQEGLLGDISDGAEGQRVFESGSRRDNDDNKPLPFELNPYMLLRYGYHLKRGQLKYGDGNWELGQPDKEVWRSLSRHFTAAYMCFRFPEQAKEFGLDQEDNLAACLFGINMLMHNEAEKGISPDHYFKKE